ncbi:hypothetical protein N9D31_01755 [Oligoflexaceae bacterium]|nr:hypothetical protein [Oligoflexaceae bacterium]
MKKFTVPAIIGILIVIGFALMAAFKLGDKSPIIAEGRVTLSNELLANARGIRTLFIITYDENSPMPMPYGAIKFKLDDDAKAEVIDFKLTKDNLRIMNQAAKVPTSLKLKARLDLDGQGGRAQPGDLVGEMSAVPTGSEDLELKITTVVE